MANVHTDEELATLAHLERLLEELELEPAGTIIQDDIKALKRVIQMLRMAE